MAPIRSGLQGEARLGTGLLGYHGQILDPLTIVIADDPVMTVTVSDEPAAGLGGGGGSTVATCMAGEPRRVKATFAATGTPTNPQTVKLFWTVTGSGVVTSTTWGATSPIVNPEPGAFYADLDTTGKPGIWTYEWVAPGQAINAAQFTVGAPPITPS